MTVIDLILLDSASFLQLLGFILVGLGFTILSFRVYESEGVLGAIGLLLPHAHAAEGYLRIIIDGGGIGDIWQQALILLGFSFLFYLVVAWRLKWVSPQLPGGHYEACHSEPRRGIPGTSACRNLSPFKHIRDSSFHSE